MVIDWTDILCTFAKTFDYVEQSLNSIKDGHCLRVAYLSALAGEKLGLEDNEIKDLIGCGIIHDNAITEYLVEEKISKDISTMQLSNFGEHCVEGEKNVEHLPFFGDCKNVVLYHHENADGSGIFGKKSGEVPLYAEIIHVADVIDMYGNGNKHGYDADQIIAFVHKHKGGLFEESIANAFITVLKQGGNAVLAREDYESLVRQSLGEISRDFKPAQLHNIGTMFARIIDYKSPFTKSHSLGIAEKASVMGKYYGYNLEEREKLYFAGCVHDIGKLLVQSKILEKEERLTADEYKHIQTHADASILILSNIKGLNEVMQWAVRHHEKLDGSGYPLGLMGEELSHNDRLLACLDIYQALVEARPYKEGFSHERAMKIILELAEEGKLDKRISDDINAVFK